jgi:hypothetical protein
MFISGFVEFYEQSRFGVNNYGIFLKYAILQNMAGT